LTIADLSAKSVSASIAWFSKLLVILNDQKRAIATTVVNEIRNRLEILDDLGLSYLTIDRSTSTLSTGESQRIKLAGQISTGLTDILYILDEPTRGLHPVDTARLMKQVRRLQESGNTLVIIEHDRDVIQMADHILDMGPGAGQNGGTIVAHGTVEEIRKNQASSLGQLLSPLFFRIPSRNHHLLIIS